MLEIAGRNCARNRRGILVVVILVAVVLGVLGGAAFMMSGGFKRQANHEALRSSARVAAKAAAEEAALLIHNGKLDVIIDEALTAQAPRDLSSFLKDRVYRSSTEVDGVTGGPPKVTVTAAVANPQGWAQTPEEQWQAIMKEVTDAKNQEAIEFWSEMKQKNLIGTAPPASTAFMDMCRDVSLARLFTHRQNPVPESNPPLFENCKCLDGVHELMALFGTTSTGADNKRSFAFNGSGPDLATFKAAWDRVVKTAAQDAAKKVESCGSNPAGAMAHLVGDLYNNEIVSSGTEREAAKNFLESSECGVTSTYLLEITAEVGYGGGPDGSRMAGTAHYTTYRLFQKAPWEKSIDAIERAVIESLLTGSGGKHRAYSPREIAGIWPAEPDDPTNPAKSKLHRVEVKPGSGELFDPAKVIARVLDDTLPAAVGSRLFPYTLVSTGDRVGDR